MARIGDQCERVGDYAKHQLHHHEEHVQADTDEEGAVQFLGRRMVVMAVGMVVLMTLMTIMIIMSDMVMVMPVILGMVGIMRVRMGGCCHDWMP
ncbi:MAG: hypothetical protein AMXMBFR8_01400 [Nevskiales bacterium]